MSNKGLVRTFGETLWREIKATSTPLQFPGFGGGSYQGFSSLFNFQQFLGGAYSGSRQNWATQVGDPSLSSLVMAAAGWVGRRLPEATFQVVKTDAEDNDEPILDHPLTELFRRPNPYYDDACLWEHFAFSWLLDGNVYWLLRQDSRGRVVEIWPLPHWMVFPRWRGENDYLSYYEYVPNGKSFYYKPSQIVHFRCGVSDPDNNRKGMSPLRSILREVFTDGELANYSAALIKNSGVPPLLVTTKEMSAGVTPEKAKEFAAEMQRRVSGDQRGKLLFQSWPLEVTKLSFDPEEMDLRKLRFMSEERFCSVVGINSIVLGFGAGSEKSIYNNVESARRSAIEEYLCPLWNRIAGTIEHQLLPQFGSEDEHVLFDTSTVVALQEKENEKHDRVRADVLAGLVKVNEAQMILGWKPDDKADYYLRPANLVEVRDGEIIAATPVLDPNQPPTDKPEELPMEKKPKELPPAREKSIKAKREYASTQVDIVGQAAALMLKFREAIPDEELADDGREGNAHITVLYGIHATQSADDVRVSLGRAFKVGVTYGRTDYFEGDDFDVVYVSVDSPDLVALNKMLKSGLEHTVTQDGYTPHATLAYVKSGLGVKYAGDGFLKGYADSFSTLVYSTPGGLRSQLPLEVMKAAALTVDDRKPSAKEIQAAVSFWTDVDPDAAGLILAETVDK